MFKLQSLHCRVSLARKDEQLYQEEALQPINEDKDVEQDEMNQFHTSKKEFTDTTKEGVGRILRSLHYSWDGGIQQSHPAMRALHIANVHIAISFL